MNPEPSLDFSSEALSHVLFERIGLEKDTSFVVAYSGGCDSSVLLYAMAKLADKIPIVVSALHANHQLHAEADEWVTHCRNFCNRVSIPFQSECININRTPGSSLEEEARRARYHWFEGMMSNDQVLLTSHHADDQAETFMLNLMRGAGVQGLSAIPWMRHLSKRSSSPLVIRPLLDFRRQSLVEYAEANRLRWVDDSANLNLSFDRNRLRHEVIPVIEQRWPQAVSLINRSAEQAREAALLLTQLAEHDKQNCSGRMAPCLFSFASPLSLDAMLKLDEMRVNNLIRNWIREQRLPLIPRKRLSQWLQQVYRQQSCERSLIEWDNCQLRCFKRHVYLVKKTNVQGFKPINWEGEALTIYKNLRIDVRDTDGWGIDREVVSSGRLEWRLRQGGEVIKLPGRRQSFRLKKIYQERQVPPWQRDRCPLLMHGEQVVWAHDVSICDVADITLKQGGLLPVMYDLDNV